MRFPDRIPPHPLRSAVAAVLGHNYPGSEWYADSYLLLTGVDSRPQENKGSWISRTFGAIF